MLAVDFHEVLQHLHSQVLWREVLHVQENDKLVTVGSDLKPRRSCGSPGVMAQGLRELAVVPAGLTRVPVWTTETEQNLWSLLRPLLHTPQDRVPGTLDWGLCGHSADNQNLGLQGSGVC